MVGNSSSPVLFTWTLCSLSPRKDLSKLFLQRFQSSTIVSFYKEMLFLKVFFVLFCFLKRSSGFCGLEYSIGLGIARERNWTRGLRVSPSFWEPTSGPLRESTPDLPW